ncbi:hypothetical protein SISSUDRAFT_1132276 [Sistotremastrum suecicum HHB10207 ss-3]|uniref:DUF6589 domain-containing protein n=1 Tax=Sistotremastrum suecicum HHB10207 ss-3 TaxID=1314776 RepID=A0A165Z2X4_9AGAM|nr:hypothetical protein SISSUDRAFT_1132276 [Sistotremastrum suecicum HHB10207 ss-3]
MTSRGLDASNVENDGTEGLKIPWAHILPEKTEKLPLPTKLYIIFSLIIHLNVTVSAFLEFIFSCKNSVIKTRVSRFTMCVQQADGIHFGPHKVWNLWKAHFPAVHAPLFDLIVIPEALDLGRKEFTRGIKSADLRLNVDTLTVKTVRDTLNLAHLLDKYTTLMPFLCEFLLHLVNTPNQYRMRKEREARARAAREGEAAGEEMGGAEAEGDGPSDQPEGDGNEGLHLGGGTIWTSREERAKLVVVTGLSNLLFVCNQATNYFSLLFGLFLAIEGSTVRVITCLNKLGLSTAQEAAQGDNPWLVVIDNLNIFSETFPMGVSDVNKGSKVGLIEVLRQLQERSGLSKEDMSSKVRIMAGDLLTILNFRRARNERADDVSSFERLSYIAEISQPFHMGLNAVIGIVKTHLGDSNINAASLSAHKELLNRKWDPKKPNYADAKALISHSLIARLLDCVMKQLGYTDYSQLEKWRPTVAELRAMGEAIQSNYLDHRKIYEAFGVNALDPEEGDHIFVQSCLFMRDTLAFEIFDYGVRHGDPGVLWSIMKLWMYSFRGAQQQNYSRECLELLIRWETELTPEMREVMESAWFYNRLGRPGRFIAIDMYLEHLNYWVKRVFIPKGTGVTVENIMSKGSSCVEALRSISAKMSAFCGLHETERRHRESAIAADVQALVERMIKEQIHVLTPRRTLWITSKATKSKPKKPPPKVSAVIDVIANGMAWWESVG